MPSTQYTLLPVGADNTFIAAIKQNRIDAGMTTEPTVSQLLKTGDAKVLVDMRTLEGTRAALGGTYPAVEFLRAARVGRVAQGRRREARRTRSPAR